MKLLSIIGTRPEAVKMAPLLGALAQRFEIISLLASTGQHRDLLRGPLDFFGLTPDYNFGLDASGQDPIQYVERTVPHLVSLIEMLRPDRVIVQGDTASALAGARAAAVCGVPLAHIEAGLRTHAALPWPEEPFRKEIDGIADLLFAPTSRAAANLAAEGAKGTVYVTGNTSIDAVQAVVSALEDRPALRCACDRLLPAAGNGRTILVTLHRRENVGTAAAELCEALADVAATGAARLIFPLHPNPQFSGPIRAALADRESVHLLEPLDLPAMVRAMQLSDLILTDSGGIQEEAPSLGRPVLVLRGITERPEGVEAGLSKLVGTGRDAVLSAVRAQLSLGLTRNPARPSPNPYGDGQAARRIVAALLGEPFEPFGAYVGNPAPFVSAG